MVKGGVRKETTSETGVKETLYHDRKEAVHEKKHFNSSIDSFKYYKNAYFKHLFSAIFAVLT